MALRFSDSGEHLCFYIIAGAWWWWDRGPAAAGAGWVMRTGEEDVTEFGARARASNSLLAWGAGNYGFCLGKAVGWFSCVCVLAPTTIGSPSKFGVSRFF